MMLFLSLLSLAILFIIYSYGERMLIKEVEEHTNDLTTAIKMSVEELTSDEQTNEARLRDYVQQLNQKGVNEISIISNEEEIIASSNPKKVGKKIDPKRKDLLITAKLGEDLGPTAKQKTQNILIPVIVNNEQVGYVHIKMVLDDFTNLLKSNNLKRLIATVFVFTIGIAVSLFLSWKYTAPIHEVVEAAKSVAAGDLSKKLEVKRNDEIGELTKSFNEMIEKLRLQKELEDRLNQAEKLSALGQFASGIAHEIRNPLNFINLSIDHIRKKFVPKNSTDKEMFSKLMLEVKDEIRRLNDLISNFLNYGKPIKLNIKEADLKTVVAEITALAEQKMQMDKINIKIDIPKDIPQLIIDKDQIKICFINVILNSIQAMPKGGDLTIKARPNHTDGNLDITFTDTGSGIDIHDMDKIFDPYFTTKDVGIGLGLALTKRIINEHKGEIFLLSRPGVGTTVTVRLPLIKAEAVAINQ
ncbi:MAG: HAMP domain-containing protein [Nitrospirae bacterium]|nr:HAMP domain-containing protein [Nitrospirota bacterium]